MATMGRTGRVGMLLRMRSGIHHLPAHGALGPIMVVAAASALVGCADPVALDAGAAPSSVVDASETAPRSPRASAPSIKPTPTASPTPTPTPRPEDELVAACTDARPVPWAAPYGGKVHPLVVVDDTAGGSGNTLDPNYAINRKWLDGAWTSPIQLVVCVPEPEKLSARVASCGKSWKRDSDGVVGELLVYQYRSKVRVVAARTGKVLQAETLRGSKPSCGGSEGYSSLDLSVDPPWRKYGYPVTTAQVNTYATKVSRQAVK